MSGLQTPGESFLEYMGVPTEGRWELADAVNDAIFTAALEALESAAREDPTLTLHMSEQWHLWDHFTGAEAGDPRPGMTSHDGWVIQSVTPYGINWGGLKDHWGYSKSRSTSLDDWPATRVVLPIPCDATAILAELRAA